MLKELMERLDNARCDLSFIRETHNLSEHTQEQIEKVELELHDIMKAVDDNIDEMLVEQADCYAARYSNVGEGL